MKFKVGDIVEVTKTPREDYFFKVGDKAVLIRKDEDGDWWADFSQNEECFFDDGKACLQASCGIGIEFRKAP